MQQDRDEHTASGVVEDVSSRLSRLHILERERTRLFSVDIGKAILKSQGRRNKHLPGFLHEMRVVRQSRDGTPDELG